MYREITIYFNDNFSHGKMPCKNYYFALKTTSRYFVYFFLLFWIFSYVQNDCINL
jgi:hypothetical protein